MFVQIVWWLWTEQYNQLSLVKQKGSYSCSLLNRFQKLLFPLVWERPELRSTGFTLPLTNQTKHTWVSLNYVKHISCEINHNWRTHSKEMRIRNAHARLKNEWEWQLQKPVFWEPNVVMFPTNLEIMSSVCNVTFILNWIHLVNELNDLLTGGIH